MTTRREFIRRIGILLASAMTAHCTPLPAQGNPARARLRKCWLGLNRLEKRARTNYERGQTLGGQLQADHSAALGKLVEVGELDTTVADDVQAIFDEAVYQIWRSLATCYEPVRIDYSPAARGQLIQQTELLAEMAAKGDLDPRTIAQAQAVLERDVAFLNLPDEKRDTLYDELLASDALPRFEELELEIDPEAAEAARFLIELLSGQ